MLVGRESLVRFIGKRRRFLPNRHRLASAPTADQSPSESCQMAKDEDCEPEVKQLQVSAPEEDDNGGNIDRVTCPVCGESVRGDDHTVNAHLDVCLSRGTGLKRKLTQFTLLQFNFGRDKTSDNSVYSGTPEAQSGPGDKLLQNFVSEQVPESGAVEDSDVNHGVTTFQMDRYKFSGVHDVDKLGGPPFGFDSGIQDEEDRKRKISVTGHKINCTNHADSALSKAEMHSLTSKGSFDHVREAVLETYIVGRRFVDEAGTNSGVRILLLRDPYNTKDSSAIKVVDADSACHKVLGFIPRDLAQCLSPMIDKYKMIFEGTVTSVPENSVDAVSIKLTCQKVPSIDDVQDGDLYVFKSLWDNVLTLINAGVKNPPSFTKYQQNFRLVLQEVLSSNSHLFLDDEKCFLETFSSLSDDAQRLFIKLYMRKGPWFRMSNISYPEILDTQQGAGGLLEAGYFTAFDPQSQKEVDNDDFKQVLNVLTVIELREIHSTFKERIQKVQVGMKKHDIVSSLLSSYKDEMRQLSRVVSQKMGMCVRVSSIAESLLWRVQRLFFLNGEQDLSAFLLADLGLVKYPKYKCLVSDKLFSDRRDLLAYEEAIEVAQIMDEALEAQNFDLAFQCMEVSESRLSDSREKGTQPLMSGSVNSFLRYFSASWVYSRVTLLGISLLEYHHRYADAIRLLKQLLSNFTCDRRRGYWTLRLSIDLEHIGLIDESLSVAEDGIRDPSVRAGPRMALQRRVIRLGKPPRRWKVPSFAQSVKRKIPECQIRGRPLNCEAGVKSRFYGEDGDQCGVEQLALQYYAGEGGGWQGVHSESGIWLTIFGLLMWDIIFSDVPNVFRSRFQIAPLDLDTDDFYTARKTLIESHLQKIHDGMAEEILIMSWDSHFGTSCRGVNWDRHSITELRAAVSCIGGACMASLCRLLAEDYRSWSSGMPDLLIWRFLGDYKGEAKLVEVKGPRDRLSEQQRAWLLALMDCGFSVEVCKVCPTSPTTRN